MCSSIPSKRQAAEKGRDWLAQDFCEDDPACPPEGTGPCLMGHSDKAAVDPAHGEEASPVLREIQEVDQGGSERCHVL